MSREPPKINFESQILLAKLYCLKPWLLFRKNIANKLNKNIAAHSLQSKIAFLYDKVSKYEYFYNEHLQYDAFTTRKWVIVIASFRTHIV